MNFTYGPPYWDHGACEPTHALALISHAPARGRLRHQNEPGSDRPRRRCAHVRAVTESIAATGHACRGECRRLSLRPFLYRGGSMAQDPISVDPKHYKVEMENDRVRVLR